MQMEIFIPMRSTHGLLSPAIVLCPPAMSMESNGTTEVGDVLIGSGFWN